MKTLTSSVLLDGLVFLEAPRRYGGKLWFSDIHGLRVMTVDLEGRSEVVLSVPQRPSGLGFVPDGRLLLANSASKCSEVPSSLMSARLTSPQPMCFAV